MIVTMRSFVPRDAFLFSAPLSLLIPRARAFARLHELNLYSNLPISERGLPVTYGKDVPFEPLFSFRAVLLQARTVKHPH